MMLVLTETLEPLAKVSRGLAVNSLKDGPLASVKILLKPVINGEKERKMNGERK